MAEHRQTSAEFLGSGRIAFGEYQFDRGAGQLWRGAEEIKLAPRASALLAALAERSTEVVTKQELIDRLWDGRAVGDDALTSCVLELRRALGDDPRKPRIVQTRHRLGYRLLLPVTPVAGANPAAEKAPPLPLSDKASIAVLPFENMSGDPEQAYFADGLAEDLITGLSHISWLFVMARNSSFAFRGEKLDVRTIGDRLGVRYLVEGSVRRVGRRLRMTVQLLEAATGNHLWADKYDGSIEDVFDFQDRIVASLVGALEPKLRATESARARRKRPDSLDAFDLFLQALPKVAALSAQSIAEAIELLDRAIALSPDYAQALAYAAQCRAWRPIEGFSPDADRDFREADELSRRALECDSMDSHTLDVVAFTMVYLHRDYQAALKLVDRSLTINPNGATAWKRRGWISAWAGETDSAIAEFEKGMRLSPHDLDMASGVKHGMASALCWGGRPEEALPWARMVHQERPDWRSAHRMLIAVLWLSGRHGDATGAARRYVELFPGFSVRRARELTPCRGTAGQELYFEALREAGLPG
ncbi:MAG: winged helix-turn-helix domain-containing tetratricopeptide repeat protein [Hyphomicrobiaceae bacterium]